MDRFVPHFIRELRRQASGRARFAARRGRGMKDHGRAQETVVIGVVRPLVIDLCRLLLDCWTRGGDEADRCGRLPGVRGRAAFTQYDCYLACDGSALRSVARCLGHRDIAKLASGR